MSITRSAAFSTEAGTYWVHAQISCTSSYYVTVESITFINNHGNVSDNASLKWRIRDRNNSSNIPAGTGIGYSFQAQAGAQYVLQGTVGGTSYPWGGVYGDENGNEVGGFTVGGSNDSFGNSSGGSGGGDSGGGDYANSYYVTYHDRDGTTLAQTTETEGQYFIAQSGSSVTRPGSSSTSSDYKITGDANGGAFSNGSTTTSITATKTTTTSYNFSSWNTNSSGTGSTYYAGSYYTMPSYNLNLYPVFSSSSSTVCSNHSLSRLPQPSYAGSTTTTLTATFNANGGSVSTTSQSVNATVTKAFGGWMNSSGTVITSLGSAGTVKAKWNNSYSNNTLVLPLPTRSGYNFNGWSTSTSGTNLQPAGKTVSITSDITYYAIWTEKEKPTGGIFIHDGTKWQLATEYVFNEEIWVSSE